MSASRTKYIYRFIDHSKSPSTHAYSPQFFPQTYFEHEFFCLGNIALFTSRFMRVVHTACKLITGYNGYTSKAMLLCWGCVKCLEIWSIEVFYANVSLCEYLIRGQWGRNKHENHTCSFVLDIAFESYDSQWFGMYLFRFTNIPSKEYFGSRNSIYKCDFEWSFNHFEATFFAFLSYHCFRSPMT